MRRLGLVGLLAILVMVATLSVSAASTTWKLYSFNNSGRNLRSEVVKVTNGSVTAALPSDPYYGAAYLMSAKTGPGTSGLSANLDAVGSADAFIENYPDCVGSATPAAYLYFQGQSKGGFEPSDYWWYGASRTFLNPLLADPDGMLMSASFSDRSGWTNYYGKPASMTSSYTIDGKTYGSPSAGFDNALAKMTDWGVSLGGTCFFATGVGATTGSASLVLQP